MFAYDAVWLIWDDVDALLVAFHTADVTADTLLSSIEALCKQGDYIMCVLLSVGLNVSFNSAPDLIVHGLVLLFIGVNFTSCFVFLVVVLKNFIIVVNQHFDSNFSVAGIRFIGSHKFDDFRFFFRFFIRFSI